LVAALIVSLALAAGGAFALRARLRGAPAFLRRSERRLVLIESLRLSHQTDVCLMRCDGREFIIAATPHGAILIASGTAGDGEERT
jgi:hypothetical protein